MTHTYKISGMTCEGCAATVKKALSAVDHITSVKIDLPAKAEVTMDHHVHIDKLRQALSSYSYDISEPDAKESNLFWNDRKTWGRASVNTFNCLVGCSIGDFGMIIFLQAFYPATSMVVQMILAILAGLFTSMLLETVLLRIREKFAWTLALQTAFSMSLLSMIAMEAAMNTTDFMITGGKAAFGNPLYWLALAIAMVAGFITPLPYNYYKLKKFNQACH